VKVLPNRLRQRPSWGMLQKASTQNLVLHFRIRRMLWPNSLIKIKWRRKRSKGQGILQEALFTHRLPSLGNLRALLISQTCHLTTSQVRPTILSMSLSRPCSRLVRASLFKILSVVRRGWNLSTKRIQRRLRIQVKGLALQALKDTKRRSKVCFHLLEKSQLSIEQLKILRLTMTILTKSASVSVTKIK
jgi:hypothetical protein